MRTIEHLITHHSGPVLTLETGSAFEKTAQYYESLSGREQLYFVKTKEDDPNPCELDWRDIFAFIDRFPLRPVQFAGGYLWKEESALHGCLGATANLFKAHRYSIKILSEATFS